MAKILIYEPQQRFRDLLRYILEGIHHEVLEADGYADLPDLLAGDPPDLLILGVHLDGLTDPASSRDWSPALPEVPVLLLFSGPDERQKQFLSAWAGPKRPKALSQPLEPYPLLALVKSMVTAPETWRQGGQHKV
jgi:DNA-binding response OmpR family regulator